MTTRAGFLKGCLAVLGGLVVGLRKPEAVTDPAPMATKMENAFGDQVPDGYVLTTYVNLNYRAWKEELPGDVVIVTHDRQGNRIYPRTYMRPRIYWSEQQNSTDWSAR